MAHLTTRRVVTGHNAEGKAIFLQDDSLISLSPMTGKEPEGSNAGITNICRTEGIPPNINAPFVDYYGKMIPLVDDSGIYCRVCHFLPVLNPEDDTLNIEHRTQSIDFGVVLEGEIQLTLDDGEKKILRKGDVIVQRGTIHDWNNVSSEICSVFFVLIPSDKVKVEKSGEYLEATKWPGTD